MGGREGGGQFDFSSAPMKVDLMCYCYGRTDSVCVCVCLCVCVCVIVVDMCHGLRF